MASAIAVKCRIRVAAEKEERELYHRRTPQAWLKALEPFGTDANKSYLKTAPYLSAVFQRNYDFDAAGERIKQYYVT